MIRRIKQFYRGYRARITEEDKEIVAQILSPQEAQLFYQMGIFDQYHTLNVYKTVVEMVQDDGNKENLNLPLLYKAALLHDIGRKGKEITLMGKVYPVLLPFLLKDKFLTWSRAHYQDDNVLVRRIACWGNYFYLYKHHPQLGAELLMKADLLLEIEFKEQLAYLIRHHHDYTLTDPAELLILQKADSLN